MSGVHDHGFNNVSTYGALRRLARRGPLRRQRVGDPLLRAGAAGERRRPGPALDADSARRLHLLVQRRAFAVRRHDPIAARARAGAPARPSPARGTGRGRRSARSAPQAREGHRRLQRLLRDRARQLRPARTGRAREPVQRREWFRIAGPTASRVTRRSRRGRAGWPGRCSVSPNSSSSSATLSDAALEDAGGRAGVEGWMRDAARATADFYIESAAAADGIPYWDTGAPGLAALGDWGARPADPFNDHEPVDSSAAAIAAQGLLRLGRALRLRREARATSRPDFASPRRCSTRPARICPPTPLTRD